MAEGDDRLPLPLETSAYMTFENERLVEFTRGLPSVCYASLVHHSHVLMIPPGVTAPGAKISTTSIRLLLGVFKLQFSNLYFLQEKNYSKDVAQFIFPLLSVSMKIRGSQYTVKSYPSAAESVDTGPEPSSLNPNTTTRLVSQMVRHGDDANDDSGQQSPGDNNSPRNRTPRPLRRCRFACHFHKHSPSLYRATSCDKRYKWCEKSGWESLTAVRSVRYPVPGINSEGCPPIVSPERYTIIDQDKWRSICKLDLSDESRHEQTWFDIWNIIFPEISLPETPWHGAGFYKSEPMTLDNSHLLNLDLELLSRQASGFILRQSHSETEESNTGIETPLFTSTISTAESTEHVENYDILRADIIDPVIGVPWPFSVGSEFVSPLPTNILSEQSDSTKCHLIVDSNLYCNEGVFPDNATAFGQMFSEQFGFDFPGYPDELLIGTESPTARLKSSVFVLDESSSSACQDVQFQKENEKEPEILAPSPGRQMSTILQGSNLRGELTPAESEAINTILGYDGRGTAMSDTSNDLASAEIWVLREALSEDLDLFARALPLFQAEWDRRNTVNSPETYFTSYGDTPQTTGTPAGQLAPTDDSKKEQQRKHRLPDDNNQEKDDDDDREPNPKRQKSIPDPDKKSEERRFACPFHKMNPLVYCAASTAGRMERNKWRMCGMPSSGRLRTLIDDHLLKKHRIYDCMDCGGEFDDPAAKHDHDFHGCPQKGLQAFKGPYREGITTADVDKIKKIQMDSKSKPQKKWMDIFQLMFPHKQLPNSPYYNEGDDMNLRPISTPEIEDLLRRFLHFNQAAIAAGEMAPIDQKTYEKLVYNFRLSIKASSIRASSSTPASMLTPSSNSITASTQSAVERLSQTGTPFSHNTRFSRFGSNPREQSANDSNLTPSRPRRLGSVVPDMSLDHASVSSPASFAERQPTYFRQPSQEIEATTAESSNLYEQNPLTQNWLQGIRPPPENSFRNIPTSRGYESDWRGQTSMEGVNNIPIENMPQHDSALTQILRRLEAAEQETRALRRLFCSPESGQENVTLPTFSTSVNISESGPSTPSQAQNTPMMRQPGMSQQNQTPQHFTRPNHLSEQSYGHQQRHQKYQQDLSPGIYSTPSNQGLQQHNNSAPWTNGSNHMRMLSDHPSQLPEYDSNEISNEHLTQLLQNSEFLNETGDITIVQHSDNIGMGQGFEGGINRDGQLHDRR